VMRPSSPIPRDFRRQELIRTPIPPAPAPHGPAGASGAAAAAVGRKEMERRTESNKSWNPVPPPASSRRMAGSMAPRASSSSGAAQDGSNRGGIEWGMETPALEAGF